MQSLIHIKGRPYLLYRIVATYADVQRIHAQHPRARYFWLRTMRGGYAVYLDRVTL